MKALAVVSGFEYAAFLTGPGIIGFLSGHLGIQRAMIVPFLAGLTLTALTFTSALREPGEGRLEARLTTS